MNLRNFKFRYYAFSIIKLFLLIAAFAASSHSIQAQTLLANYPLQSNLSDATGNFGNVILDGNPTPPSAPTANGLCINGIYIHHTNGQEATTPTITSLNSQDFQMEIDLALNSVGTLQTIIIGGFPSRWMGIFVDAIGNVGVTYNNSFHITSGTTLTTNTLYTARLKYTGGIAQLSINGVVALTSNIGSFYIDPLHKHFLTGNHANGTTFNGCFKNLKFYNSPIILTTQNYSANTSGGCGAFVNFSASAVGTPAPTITYSHASGSLFPVGVTNVTATATNSNGSVSQTFTVTVIDVQNPVIICNSDINTSTTPGQCSNTTLALSVPFTNDNCGIFLIQNNAPAFFPVGTTTVTWIATDFSFNTTSCTQKVIVADNEPPSVTCNPNIYTTTSSGVCGLTGLILFSPSANDNCGIPLVHGDAPAFYPIGTTTVTWIATSSNGLKDTCYQLVTVENPCLDDGNICTIDTCIAGSCVNIADTSNASCCANTADCNDNDVCTLDTCENNFCVFIPIDCDDGTECTLDYCDAAGCHNDLIICDDFNSCTIDSCSSVNGCIYSQIICADDGDPCTNDTCINGTCTNVARCDDGLFCTIDSCVVVNSVFQQCLHTPRDCDDGDPCTIDQCGGGIFGFPVFPDFGCAEACFFCAISGGLFTEACDFCGLCETASDICVNIPINCDDGNLCTRDSCDGSGICVYDTLNCDDNNVCTEDICQDGVCQNNMISGCDPCATLNCDDNNSCTLDSCNNGNCFYTPKNCADNDPCTVDACNSTTGICTNLPQSGIISLTLVNSDTDIDIRQLNTSDTIKLSCEDDINIRANTCGSVQSVRFKLNSNNNFRTENDPPYALVGDNPPGNYHKWNANPGTYTITATPYSSNNAGGTAGNAKTITILVQGMNVACAPPCSSDADCNDNNACTMDACVSGSCKYTPINCDDGNACTLDSCNFITGCFYTTRTCFDKNSCTTDSCSTTSGCVFTPVNNCCNTASDCDDNNPCTIDICENNECAYRPAGTEPSYLQVINPAKSWRKLKLGYSSTSLWTPTQNVTAGGHNQLCVTLRTVGTPEWNKIQIRPQGTSNTLNLSTYFSGSISEWTIVCIPLSNFPTVDFTKLSYIEIPYSNGAQAFEIHIKKIEFTKVGSSFVWFGESKTDNFHDGESGSGSALTASLVEGNLCAATKRADEMIPSLQAIESVKAFINAYPNPFSEEVNIEFSLAEEAKVRVEIVGIDGKLIDVVFEGNAKANELQTHRFRAVDLSNGMYFYRMMTENGEVENKKLILIR